MWGVASQQSNSNGKGGNPHDLVRFEAKCSMLKETFFCTFQLWSGCQSWKISWWKMGILWECEYSTAWTPPVMCVWPQNQGQDSSSGRNIEFFHRWDPKSLFSKRWQSEIWNLLVFYDLGSDKRSHLCCVRMWKCIFNAPHKWVGFCRCWISGWKRGRKINWIFFFLNFRKWWPK